MDILFRTQSGLNTGTAHVRRCLLIAHELRKKGHQPLFLVEADDSFQLSLVKQDNFSAIKLPSAGLQLEELSLYPNSSRTIILDLQNSLNIKEIGPYLDYLNALKKNGYKILFIDALFDEAFREPTAPVLDCCIQPYLGAERDSHPKANIWIKGADYFLMSDDYEGAKPKAIPTDVQNLLLTFGGSDPQELAAYVLEALMQGHSDIPSCRMIVGPYFTPEHRKRLDTIAANYPSIQLIENCKNLIPHYEWADFAVGSSGLSRYEFAAMGLPAMILSIYPYHHRQCEIFNDYGISKYLGYYEEVDHQQIIGAFTTLRANQAKRESLSRTGQNFIKAGGAQRLVQQLFAQGFLD